MTHAQCCNTGHFLCGAERHGHRTARDGGICVDSHCDHCDNDLGSIDCPVCRERLTVLHKFLTGAVPWLTPEPR